MNSLDNEQLRRANEIVKGVLEHPANDRSALIAAECGDDEPLRQLVLSLVQSAESDPSILKGGTAMRSATAVSSPEASSAKTSRFGSYQLLEKIGEGGFGIVYAADQLEPVKRRVALKVIKAGMDTKEVLARFEAERQALARMDHPNIAKVLDAGETPRGRPYFVMELVKGERITHYCDRHRLSTRERMALFIPVCRAVQHAHQKGIIHRDLKPTNILVTLSDNEPTPKVIDFGIAKATTEGLTDNTLYTRQGQLMGTPSYMSPEQAEMGGLDIDTRTDIYSLGVVLYQLTAGVLPFDMDTFRRSGYAEILRVLREEEPPKPSDKVSTLGEASSEAAKKRKTEPKTLRRQLRGEFDWIVLKAMEKDRTRRYETAAGLGADIQRYLDDEPVLAGPPSRLYKFRKFAKRNKGILATTALFLITIIGALVQSNLQRIQVEKSKSDLEAVTEFQKTMLRKVEPEKMGLQMMEQLQNSIAEVSREHGAAESEIAEAISSLDLLVRGVNLTDQALGIIERNILAGAVESLDGSFASQPLIDAELRDTLGVTYQQFGLYGRAEPLLRKALETRTQLLGNNHPDTLSSLNEIGSLLSDQGKLEEAGPYKRAAMAGRRNVLGDDHPDTLQSISNFGGLLFKQGNFQEAGPYYREALDRRRRVLGDGHRDTLSSISDVGVLLEKQGMLKEAEPYFREALEGRRRVLGDDHRDTLISINNMGVLYLKQGKFREAEPYLREALEGDRRVLGDDHPDTLRSINNFGGLLYELGKTAESESYYREALDGSRRVLGDDHPDTLRSINNFAILLHQRGALEEAESFYREALNGRRRVLGEDHPDTLASINNVGVLLERQGKFEGAGPYLLEALEGYRRVLGDDYPDTLASARFVGVSLLKQGQPDEAEPFLREALDGGRRVLGDDHPDLLASINSVGELLHYQDKYEEAETYYREALEGYRRRLGEDHGNTVKVMANLGALWTDMARFEEADVMLSQALDKVAQAKSMDPMVTGTTMGKYGRLLNLVERYEQSENMLLEAYNVLFSVFGVGHPEVAIATKNLDDLYLAWDDPQKTAEWQARQR